MGRAEVRVAFNDRAERYHSRNLVTERDVTERAVIGQVLADFPASPLPFNLETAARRETCT